MNRSVVAALLAVVVLGGGVVAFVLYRESSAEQERVAALASEVTVELSADKVDRGSVSRLLKRVKQAIDAYPGDPPAELLRARCRLEFSIERLVDAWDSIAELALSPAAAPEDLLLGGLVQMRLFELKGATGATEALGLASAHYQATNLPASLFRAWQMAYRMEAVDSWLEFHRELTTDHKDLPEGAFAQVSGYGIGLLIARRLGVADDDIQKIADSGADDELSRLCAHIVANEKVGKELRAGALIELAREWDEIPPEMNLLIATSLVSNGKPSEEQIHDALERVRLVLERDPANPDARHAVAILHLQVGDKAECTRHLQWLQKNASKVDSRRRLWGRMLEMAR